MLFRREPPVRNDDPEHEAQSAGPLRRWFRWLVLGFAALLLATLAVWVLTGPPPGPPPVITGPDLPDRRAPGDQSGLVPNQDQPIYDQVTPGAEAGRGQDLLAQTERPMAQADVEARAKMQDQARSGGAEPAPPERSAPVEKPAASGEATKTEPPSTAAAPARAPTPPTAPPPTAPVSVPAAAPPAGQQYRVQIASVRTEAEAEAEWKRVSGLYPEFLGRLKPTYERFETQNSGVYYRVQGGPLVDKTLAELLCSQLTSRKVPCLVISP
ncbi:MAG: SPOR domain-containing protein [Alphaproteobacteria bacterium]|nr:SPOR domain-containing protein [Alphaproteobacteria bacterium]MCB9930884.1 SPOR domain-containing protein [Alphaproteobacteria bacterium]